MKKRIYIGLGMINVAIGAIGIFVPGLPTTGFLLIASYFFARSSPRLQRKLLEHPRLGPYLKMAADRAMPVRAKVITLVAMWTGILLSVLLTASSGPVYPVVVIGLGIVGTAVITLWIRNDAAVAG